MTAHVVFSPPRYFWTCELLPARVVSHGRVTVRPGNTCLVSGSVSHLPRVDGTLPLLIVARCCIVLYY